MPENTGNTRNDKGQFLPGVSGNPAGKPLGATSITAALRRFLEDNPDKFKELVMEYLEDKRHRDLLWRQLDGNPQNKTDHTTQGQPIPILGINVSENFSNGENSKTQEED